MLSKKVRLPVKSFLPLLVAIGLVLASCSGLGAGDTAGEQPSGGDVGGAQTEGEAADGQGQDTGVDAAGGSGLCANPYFPVVNGATWTYSVTGSPIQDFSYTDTITNASANGFTLSTSFALEGGLQRTQAWGCQADGLVALEYTGGPSASLSSEGLVAEFNTTAVTGITLPVNLAVGSSWTQTMEFEGDMTISEGTTATTTGSATFAASAVGNETVTTPAGTFETIKVEIQQTINITANVSGVSMPITFTGVATAWYASGVGMVKTVQTEDFMGSTSTIELQSYSIP